MKLLYRAVKKEDEFVVDYIARIATKNGYKNAMFFKKILRQTVDVHQDIQRSDLYDQAKWRIGLELCLSRNVSSDEYRRVTSSKSFLWRKQPTICEKCFSTEPYIRFYWWISSYKTCHIHGSNLSDTSKNPVNHQESLINFGLQALLPEILKRSFTQDNCQKVALNEIDKWQCDFKILLALKDYFVHNNLLKEILLRLEAYLCSGSLLQSEPDARISKIAEYLARSIGSYWFWLRIICLLIFNHKKGLRSSFTKTDISLEYRKVSIYYLSVDEQLDTYISQISEHRSTKETLAVSLESLLLAEIEFTTEFIRAYRYSLFRCRTLDYFEQFLGRNKCFAPTIQVLLRDTGANVNTSREY